MSGASGFNYLILRSQRSVLKGLAKEVVTARSAENVAESERLCEEATEMGKETVMQAKCEARSILFGEDLTRITHAEKIRFKALLSESRLLRKNSPQPLSTISRGDTITADSRP